MTKKLASRKGLIVTTVIFVLFIAFVLPYFSSITSIITDSTFSPDTGFFYSPDTFFANMEIYGSDGRKVNIMMRLTFDII